MRVWHHIGGKWSIGSFDYRLNIFCIGFGKSEEFCDNNFKHKRFQMDLVGNVKQSV